MKINDDFTVSSEYLDEFQNIIGAEKYLNEMKSNNEREVY